VRRRRHTDVFSRLPHPAAAPLVAITAFAALDALAPADVQSIERGD
jgi:hypothetical protein